MRAAVFAVMLLLATPAWAVTSPDEMLPDPALEARARDLGRELRCLVCQNQSIDDSDADLAKDLRKLVRERITAGDTDEQAMDYITARYGDFVKLRPPLEMATLLLWFGPLAALAFGFVLVRGHLRGRGEAPAPLALDPAETATLDRLLGKNGPEGRA